MEIEKGIQQTHKSQEDQKIKEQKNLDSKVVLKFFVKKGFLLDQDLLNFFSNFGDLDIAQEILDKISIITKTRVVTKAMILKNFNDIKPLFLQVEQGKREVIEGFFKILPQEDIQARENELLEKQNSKLNLPGKNKKKELRYKILSSNIIPDRKIEMKDFITHFKNRYNFLKDILMQRKELVNLTSIDKIGDNRIVSVIGLVNSKRITKNKNLLLEIEDPTGRITAVINQNKPELFKKAKEILLDDVIGLKCSGGSEILFVNDLFFPDAIIEEKAKSLEESYAVFISDTHFGSDHFLEKGFTKFIDWLNCIGVEENQQEKIKRIKYMFIVGDTIDGVGIYPGQEDSLVVKDIREQYVGLAKFLSRVPKHITMFMCPGQHDAVRVPEPQPPIEEDFAEPMTKIDNLVLVSNPSMIEIECNEYVKGIKVLMYHGASLHSWINEIEELRINDAHKTPAKVVRYLLEHRHLSPTHSATTYVPGENEDSMVIKEVPDIITTGEVHKTDIDIYNNILIISNSCWQSQTAFEEKIGNFPDPCKVPMLNLKTREIKILDFSDEGDNRKDG